MSGQENIVLSYSIMEMFTGIITSIIIYLTSCSIVKNKNIALFTAIMSFLCIEFVLKSTIEYLAPQNIASLVGIILLASSYDKDGSHIKFIAKETIVFVFLDVVLMVYLHFYLGVLLVLFGIISFLFTFHLSVEKSYVFKRVVLVIGFILLVLAVIFKWDFSFTGLIFAKDYSLLGDMGVGNLSFEILKTLFMSEFGILSILFLVIFLYYLFFLENQFLFIILLIGLSSMILIATGFPYWSKDFLLIKYVFLFGFSYTLYIVRNRKVLLVLLGTLCVFVMIPTFFQNVAHMKSLLDFKSSTGRINQVDLDAIHDINEFVAKDALVVSDPMTMHYYEASIFARTPGGRYAEGDKKLMIYDYTEGVISPVDLYAELGTNEIYYIINNRTERWLQTNREEIAQINYTDVRSFEGLDSDCDKYSNIGNILVANSYYCLIKAE
jgi:hypothetical protein